jgi:hypothetical protein
MFGGTDPPLTQDLPGPCKDSGFWLATGILCYALMKISVPAIHLIVSSFGKIIVRSGLIPARGGPRIPESAGVSPLTASPAYNAMAAVPMPTEL